MKKRELNIRFRHEEIPEIEFIERRNKLIQLLGDEIIKNQLSGKNDN